MANKKFKNRYRIPSARANWHDYNGGAYFITICTANRQHYFGFIKNNQMHYSEIGKYVFENLQNIQLHYPYAEIPLFVVMPNHLHAVVFIDEEKQNNMDAVETRHDMEDVKTRRDMDSVETRRDMDSVETRRAASLQNNAQSVDMMCDINDVETRRAASLQQSNREKMQEIANKKGLLSVCLGGLKSAVTKYAHTNNIDFGWQTRFHDHIIRDTNDMNRIAIYIENNVTNWETDCFYDLNP